MLHGSSSVRYIVASCEEFGFCSEPLKRKHRKQGIRIRPEQKQIGSNRWAVRDNSPVIRDATGLNRRVSRAGSSAQMPRGLEVLMLFW